MTRENDEEATAVREKERSDQRNDPLPDSALYSPAAEAQIAKQPQKTDSQTSLTSLVRPATIHLEESSRYQELAAARAGTGNCDGPENQDLFRQRRALSVRSHSMPRFSSHLVPHQSRMERTITVDEATAANTSIVAQQEAYILKVCRSLIMYGAPTHRLEEYVQMTADILNMRVQSFYLPGCMIISFNDSVWRSTEVHIVRCSQMLNLSKLYKVHTIYKNVIHGRISVADASTSLENLMASREEFPPWFRVTMYGLASAFIGPVSYGARAIDLPIIFLLGTLIGVGDLMLVPRSDLYAHVFEITATILSSFLGRAFGSIKNGDLFCFSAISQASIVLILPGFTITTGALELQSKNIVSGSVRIVYAVIYTLFLAFGTTIGTTIYGVLDSGATSALTCSTTTPFYWQVAFVIPFTFCWILVNQGPWAKMPVMLLVTLAGWLVNHFAANAKSLNATPQIPQALGALTAGILANLDSRLRHGLAVALLHPAIFIQVPGSLAASGGFLSGLRVADQITGETGTKASTDNGREALSPALNAGYSMIEIAIGITVGLSVSALVVYPFRKKKGKSGLFSF